MCMNCNHCFKSEKNGYLYCKHPDVIRSRGYSPYCIKEGSIVCSFRCPLDGRMAKHLEQWVLIPFK